MSSQVADPVADGENAILDCPAANPHGIPAIQVPIGEEKELRARNPRGYKGGEGIGLWGAGGRPVDEAEQQEARTAGQKKQEAEPSGPEVSHGYPFDHGLGVVSWLDGIGWLCRRSRRERAEYFSTASRLRGAGWSSFWLQASRLTA